MLFAGTLFPAGEDELKGLYRFDSYRLTYRYGLVRARRFSLASFRQSGDLGHGQSFQPHPAEGATPVAVVRAMHDAGQLGGLEVPEKGRHLRVLIAELNRIASHLVAMGTYGLDLGSFTPFLYAFREREKILDLFEEACGARLTYSYITPGGATERVRINAI